jgi:hypothetical protein
MLTPNKNIGNPKLFIAGEESEAKLSPQPAVNNFVGASAPRQESDGWIGSFVLSGFLGFSASAGQVCEQTVALTTFSFTDQPAGRT